MENLSESKDSMQRQMRKFNPGLLQSDEEVSAQFVVRENEFQTVCETVRGNIASPSCQHVLVVGSRGQGKSMLLRRVEAELRMDRELSSHYLPVRFMEENQEIDSLADFWLETLFQLARELASEDASLSNELMETHKSLMSRWREQGFEELARSSVLDTSDRLRRRLVLMVENVQSLFAEDNEDFGWGLRAVLQTMPQITLIASATSRFEALQDPQAPFFELFRLVYLNPLNTEECGRLWSIVSETESEENEIRPLEILTGGNPRLIVIVATFARHRSLRQLMEELVILVDEHSEYFRSHLDLLPKNERRVFVALIDLWRASSASDIAARARIDVRVVSTMLRRLIDRGAVMIVEGYGARKRLYTVTDRLFSIYYKLRRENNERAVVESLIHFMVSFYDVREMRTMSEKMFVDALESSAIQAGIASALENRTKSVEVDVRLKWDEVARASEKINNESEEKVLSLLEYEISNSYREKHWRKLLDSSERYVARDFLSKLPESNQDQIRTLINVMRSDAYLELSDFDHVISLGRAVEVTRYDSSNETSLHASGRLKMNQCLAYFSLRDFPSVVSECKKIFQHFVKFEDPIFINWAANALLLHSEAENELGNVSKSIELLDEVLLECGENDDEFSKDSVAQALFRKGELLGGKCRDFRGSAACFEEFIERYEDDENESIRRNLVPAKMNQVLNHGLLGDFDREIAYCESVINAVTESEKVEDHRICFNACLYKSRRLAELGRAKEALASCDQLQSWMTKNPVLPDALSDMGLNWYTKCTRALALTYLGHMDAALTALQEAYGALDLERDSDLPQIMRLVSELLSAGAKEQDLIEVFQRDEQNAWNLLPLLITLQQRGGMPVSAPIEALEVAEDLHECIQQRLAHGLQPGYSLSMATT